MIDYVKQTILDIRNKIKRCSERSSNVFLLCADEGSGKTTIANGYSETYADTLSFRCSDEYSLATLMTEGLRDKNYDRNKCVFRPLIEKVKKRQIGGLIFDIEGQTNEDFIDLLMQIFDIFEQQNYLLNLLIFLDNTEYHKLQLSFSKHPKIIFLEALKKWQKHDFVQLWHEIYPLCEPNMNLISLIDEYSIGNVGIFLKNLNDLKFFKLVEFDGEQLTVIRYGDIEEFLKESYSEVVYKKYESLSEDLQLIIKKASSIGKIFPTETLKQAFNIRSATLLLKQIEKLSMLLHLSEQNNGMGNFDTEDAQLQIEEMIEDEQLVEWCEVLGNYYEGKLDGMKLNSIERSVIKEKCIIYFFKANNFERVIFHYLTIIPIQFRLCQYKSSVLSTKKLISIVKDRIEFYEIYIECFRTLAIIYKVLVNYEAALANLNKYIELLGIETFETKAFKSELLYDVGEVQHAHDIMKELYKNLSKIEDPHLKTNIVSILSSIEETCGEEYIKHFNEALAIAKQNKLYFNYYRLLRKANIAHFGENGIKLMKAAEKYYKENNIISELIMVRHNIGTEALFYENTYKYSIGYLRMAYKDASEIGFEQPCYIKNSIALSAILEGDYQGALDILEPLLNCKQEDFTLIALYINVATCFRKKKCFTNFWECFYKALEINSKPQNNFPFFSGQLDLQDAFFHIESRDYKAAINKLNEYFNNKYDDRITCELSAKIILKDLCEKTNSVLPDFLVNFANDSDSISRKIANDHLVLCELFFWE